MRKSPAIQRAIVCPTNMMLLSKRVTARSTNRPSDRPFDALSVRMPDRPTRLVTERPIPRPTERPTVTVQPTVPSSDRQTARLSIAKGASRPRIHCCRCRLIFIVCLPDKNRVKVCTSSVDLGIVTLPSKRVVCCQKIIVCPHN